VTHKLIIFGAGGHAVSVASVALASGYEIAVFVDANKSGSNLFNYPVACSVKLLGDPREHVFAIAIGDNFLRNQFFSDLSNQDPELVFPPLIHPTAVVSSFSSIGSGSILMPLSLVGPNTHIQKFCILNSASCIDHDGKMSDFSSLAPGATLGGSVVVGARSAISIGAVVKHGIKIGADVVLGANSYLNSDLDEACVAYGSPAKSIRNRGLGERYL
jgi:sugar O-acyltransferase (sialic acid O-acetyltransferase NeuD family)